MVLLLFSEKPSENQGFFNISDHPTRSTFKTAGELMRKPESHAAGNLEFNILGLHFCLHSAAEV